MTRAGRAAERLPGENALFRGGPDGAFARATSSGLGDGGYGMGTAVADYDADGFPDVFVANFGPNRLFRNNGDGTFEDVTEHAGLGDGRWSVSATWPNSRAR